MLTANQFHKQSGIKVEFQEFLQRMKSTFGENFMDNVNAGKVKLQEVQKALGLKETAPEKPKTAATARKVKAIKATKSMFPERASQCVLDMFERCYKDNVPMDDNDDKKG